MSIFVGHPGKSASDGGTLVLIDAVWSGNFERGEIVSPVGCIASKVSGLDLATPDARHRRPLKFFLYCRSVKNQSVLFHYCSTETARPSSRESFAKQWFVDFVASVALCRDDCR
jgi:hypothetical protein